MARALLLMETLEIEAERDKCLKTAKLRRFLRDHAMPCHLSDKQFVDNYRITKELFFELCHLLRPHMSRRRRSTKVSLECKVLTTLSFYATGSYQKPVGMSYLHALSQPSVSNAVREVTAALNRPAILRKYIKFPQNAQERQAVKNGFYEKFGMPGCLGCIDGTHVALVPPMEHEERFFNRKLYHSRNVQIICNSDLTILHIDASFGGQTHDAHIWRCSEVQDHIQHLSEREAVWFLGDSGYPLRPWLLTPIVNAEPGSADEHYTKVQCLARNTVERCIGVLKARWRCLLAHRTLHYDHHIVAKIINACAVLHNICTSNRLPPPELPEEDEEEEARLRVPREPHRESSEELNSLNSGRRQRNVVVERLWSAQRQLNRP